MGTSAARKAAVARKRRTAAKKANPTRKRRAAGSTPSVVPMISYEDGVAALAWLRKAFGFVETARLTTPDGRLSHGEMKAGEGCEQARKWSAVPWIIDGVLVYVDDLDLHFNRARAAGAMILSEIEEGPPGRRYRAEDLEGHRWFFFEKDAG